MGINYRNIKAVKQIDQTTCWAACLEWWLKAVPDRPNISQEDALARYHQYWQGTSDGSITKQGILQLVYDTSWRMDVQLQLAINFQENVLLEHISRGPIYFGYYENNVGGNHVNVIYDVFEKKSGLKLRAMEPDKGRHKTRSLSHYTVMGEIILASPKA